MGARSFWSLPIAGCLDSFRTTAIVLPFVRFPLLLAMAATASLASGQPLPLRNHRSLSLPFLRLPPITRPLSATSEWSLRVSESNEEGRHQHGARLIAEDGEFTRATAGYRARLDAQTEWMAEASFLAFHGGFMDPVIDALHRLIGFQDALRDASPAGRSFLSVNGKEFKSFRGIGGLSLSAIRSLPRGWIATAAVKIPNRSADGLADSGGWDAGAGLGWSRDLGKGWSADLHAAWILQGRSGRLPGVRRWVDQEMAAITWSPNSKDRWTLQYMSEASALRTFIPSSDAAHRSGALGYRRALAPGRTLEAFIVEDYDPIRSFNPASKNIGPDVTIGVGLTWQTR